MASSSSSEFKQFDVVPNAVNDNFFNHELPSPRPRPSPSLYKKIMQEWRILEKNLPDSIFVRVSETNIDFLRAAIVGSAGTPYHDALFCFDLYFPPDYPYRPPLVHFDSHGRRINPNLYDSGAVCLSLLNTWSGEKSERWNPNESTVLQVLVFIQALVLNAKPYFNEPGVSFNGNSERNSRAYNENAFLLTWKTTQFVVRRPPTCFEELAVGHFRRRVASVLGAFWAYAEGRVRVGEWNVSGTGAASRKAGKVSRKFLIPLAAVYKDLVAEFKAKEISVEGFAEVLEVETTASGGENGRGILKRFVGKMKEMLGMKKEMLALKKKMEEEAEKNACLIGWIGYDNANGDGVV